MSDETDDETIEHEGAAEEQRTTATPADVYGGVLALIGMIQNPRAFKSNLKEFRQAETAANKAAVDLVTAQAAFDQETAAARAELATERADIEKRRLAVHAAEGSLATREKRQAELEKLWHDIGEPAEVLSGFKDPERPALHKALRAHGLVDEDVPAPLREDRSGQPFPPDTTITHNVAARERPAGRSQRVRADQ
jgi:hypothetical protein